jgi:hypothetical protein
MEALYHWGLAATKHWPGRIGLAPNAQRPQKEIRSERFAPFRVLGAKFFGVFIPSIQAKILRKRERSVFLSVVIDSPAQVVLASFGDDTGHVAAHHGHVVLKRK